MIYLEYCPAELLFILFNRICYGNLNWRGDGKDKRLLIIKGVIIEVAHYGGINGDGAPHLNFLLDFCGADGDVQAVAIGSRGQADYRIALLFLFQDT